MRLAQHQPQPALSSSAGSQAHYTCPRIIIPHITSAQDLSMSPLPSSELLATPPLPACTSRLDSCKALLQRCRQAHDGTAPKEHWNSIGLSTGTHCVRPVAANHRAFNSCIFSGTDDVAGIAGCASSPEFRNSDGWHLRWLADKRHRRGNLPDNDTRPQDDVESHCVGATVPFQPCKCSH